MDDEFLAEGRHVGRPLPTEVTTDEHTCTINEMVSARDREETAGIEEETAARVNGHASRALEREGIEDRATRQSGGVRAQDGIRAQQQVSACVIVVEDIVARSLQVGHELRAHARNGPKGITAGHVILGDKESDARTRAGVIRHNPWHDLGVRNATTAKGTAELSDQAPAQRSAAIRTDNGGRVCLRKRLRSIEAEVVATNEQGRRYAPIKDRGVRTNDLEGNRPTSGSVQGDGAEAHGSAVAER